MSRTTAGFLVWMAAALGVDAFAGAAAPVRIRPAPTPPRIDGRLDDPCWRSAAHVGPFLQLGKKSVAEPQTTAWITSDANHLYFGIACREPKIGALKHSVTHRDGPVFEDDCVEVFIAPQNAPAPYFHFLVNCAGVLRDERGKDAAWNAHWRARTRIGKDGWYAEIAIPFAALPITDTSGLWRLNLAREDRASGVLSTWAPLSGTFHAPERFPQVQLTGIDLGPFVRKTLGSKRRRLGARLAELAGKIAALPDSGRTHAVHAELRRLEDILAKTAGALRHAKTRAELRTAARKIAALETGLPRLAARAALARALGNAPANLRAAGYLVCRESTMRKILPGRPYTPHPSRQVSVSLARREREGAEIVVVPVAGRLEHVNLRVTELRTADGARFPRSEIRINTVGYVNIDHPSGGAKFGPGEFPDPLLPQTPTAAAPAHPAVFWLTFHARADQKPGIYRGRLIATPRNAPRVELPLQVRVWHFALPKQSFLRSCYLINPAMILRMHRFPGWEFGTWTGADVRGIANYFGTGEFTKALVASGAGAGKRCVRITARNLRHGSREGPRACFYTHSIPLEPSAEYEFSFLYRTSPGARGCAGFYLAGLRTETLPPAPAWKPVVFRFKAGGRTETRVYLGAYAPGEVWYDDVRLRKTPNGRNLVKNGSFERGSMLGKSEQRELIRAYRLDALEHRASTADIAAPKIVVAKNGRTAALDWTDFDRDVAFYLDHGQNAFNIHWTRLPRGWGRVESVTNPDRLALCRFLLEKTQQHLDRKGWTDLAYIYAIDEPGRAAFPGVKAAFSLVRRAAPRLKTLLTFGYGATRPWRPGAAGRPAYAELAPWVDIFVPHTDCFDPKFLDTQRTGRHEIWAYVCISAQHPYANIWAIDYPGCENRVLFWQFFRYRIQGFLYWQITYWKNNPWTHPMTYPGGNGDGSLVYPGDTGPVDSIRWEIVRDGTEDYDMLTLLRRAAGNAPAALRTRIERLLNLDAVTRSFTEYTENPDVIERRRLEIGAILDALAQKPQRR